MTATGGTGGRTVVTTRAIERVVRAVTAEQLAVDVRSVSADLVDEAGRLEVAVRTPIRVVPIGRLQADERAIERAGGTVVERATRGESAIVEQVGAITGAVVSRLSLRLTEAVIRQERRVR